MQGNKILTNFHGMDLTRNKICSLVKKCHTLIEAWVDVKTTDGYVLRLFCIGFTKRRRAQVKTSYAQASQIRNIREKMVSIIKEEEKSDLKEIALVCVNCELCMRACDVCVWIVHTLVCEIVFACGVWILHTRACLDGACACVFVDCVCALVCVWIVHARVS